MIQYASVVTVLRRRGIALPDLAIRQAGQLVEVFSQDVVFLYSTIR